MPTCLLTVMVRDVQCRRRRTAPLGEHGGHDVYLAALGQHDGLGQCGDILGRVVGKCTLGHGDAGSVVIDHEGEKATFRLLEGQILQFPHRRPVGHAGHEPLGRLAHPRHGRPSRRRGHAPGIEPPVHAPDLSLLGQGDVGGEQANGRVVGAVAQDLRHLHRLLMVHPHITGEPDGSGVLVGR
ncbi:hypothetical protein BH24ACT1_BH24ACT1_12340 [soil metagenome]